MNPYLSQTWFQALSHDQQDLVTQAHILIDREKKDASGNFHDYSFIVFPMAKAYEGFLKQFFLDLGIITSAQFNSTHFRIGKRLNPDLPTRYRRSDWIVDLLDDACPNLSHVLWRAWRLYRNHLFHFFPEHTNFISLSEAESGLKIISQAIKSADACSRLANHNPNSVK